MSLKNRRKNRSTPKGLVKWTLFARRGFTQGPLWPRGEVMVLWAIVCLDLHDPKAPQGCRVLIASRRKKS